MLLKTILITSPHPDDAVLGCGGTIIKSIKENIQVYVIYLTDGRACYTWARIKSDLTPSDVAAGRKKEAIEGCKILGVPESNLKFLEIWDRELNKPNNINKALAEVKEIVKKYEGRSRAGLMLGLQEIGSTMQGFIGAYYPVASNIIIINKTPLRRIYETNPNLLKPYGFHVLLHEYLHTLGLLDEAIARQKTYEISNKHFGENHVITKLSTDIREFFPNLVYPIQGWLPPKGTPDIEIVKGFDQSNVDSYIT